MACNYTRNSKGQIISATTNTGQESLLYKQLKNISEDKQEVAVRLLAVTETQEFQDWARRGKGIEVNNVGEPALFGEFYKNKEGETWWAKSINQADATKKFAFGLNRVPGLTARQVNDIAAFTYSYMLRKTDAVEDVAEIDLKNIKNLYFFKSKRWDIETNSGTLIRLPKYDLEKSLNLSLEIMESSQFNKISILDLRQKNQVIVNGK